ncbi:MAG TPA: condensation domain-containing protein, partial [Pseudonocardiaceae bacterium]
MPGPTPDGLSEVKRELLARLLKGGGGGAQAAPLSRIPAVPPDRRVRLSFAQERVWLTCQLAGDVPVFNLMGAGRLRMPLDVEGMRLRLEQIVQRHDALRMSVAAADGEGEDGVPTLVVHDTVPVEIPVTDLRDIADLAEREATAERLMIEIALRPYDLERAPLWRLELLRLGDEEYLMVVGNHHLILDATSMNMVIGELVTPPDDSSATSFRDFAHWQREQFAKGAYDDQLRFWHERLSALPPPLVLPSDRPRRDAASYAGDTLRFIVPGDVADRLRELGKVEGTTLYAVVLSSFMSLLSRYTGQTDVLVGTQVSGRQLPELHRAAGMFVNLIPIRASLAGEVTFREVVRRVQASLTESFAHQDVPFEKLVQDLRGDVDRSHAPLVQVSCNMPQTTTPPGGEEVPTPMAPGGSLIDLTLHVLPRGRALEFQFEYPTALFDATTVERMARNYGRLLRALSADPDGPLVTAELIGPRDRELLAELGSGAEPGDAATLPGLVTATVAAR